MLTKKQQWIALAIGVILLVTFIWYICHNPEIIEDVRDAAATRVVVRQK